METTAQRDEKSAPPVTSITNFLLLLAWGPLTAKRKTDDRFLSSGILCSLEMNAKNYACVNER
jgi:hypothetical protein